MFGDVEYFCKTKLSVDLIAQNLTPSLCDEAQLLVGVYLVTDARRYSSFPLRLSVVVLLYLSHVTVSRVNVVPTFQSTRRRGRCGRSLLKPYPLCDFGPMNVDFTSWSQRPPVPNTDQSKLGGGAFRYLCSTFYWWTDFLPEKQTYWVG